jgi:hypothetical protein
MVYVVYLPADDDETFWHYVVSSKKNAMRVANPTT